MKKTAAIVLAMVMAMSLLTACGNSTQSTTAAAATTAASAETTAAGETKDTGTIKIGGTGPLTGGAALYGLAAQRGAQIAVDEINALGGVQFELKYEDDTHDAEKAVNAYNTLIDWGMQLSVGSVTTAPCRATAEVTKEEQIFALTPSASGPAVIEAGEGYEFQICFSDPNQGSASAQYIATKQLGEKIAVIYKNDEDYSSGIYESFIAKAEELKLNVVYTGTFTADSSTDFSVQVAAAKDAGADILFLPMYYQPASLIITECNKIGYDVKFFGVDGMDGILGMEGFDTSLAEGVMLLTPFVADADDAATKSFVAKYQAAWNETPIQFAADAYDVIYALYEGVQAAGITSDMTAQEMSEKLVALFTGDSFQFTGLTGENMTWDETGAVTKDPKGMVIQNGVYVGMD